MLTAPPLIGDGHPGINFSRLEIAGDLGGLVAALGTVFIVVAGVPQARPFFAGAVGGGVIVAALLAAWHRPPGGPRRGQSRIPTTS